VEKEIDMKVIMLKGASHKGKTMTLRMVFEKLKSLDAELDPNFKNVPIPPKGDFGYKLNYNGKNIYINTGGDTAQHIFWVMGHAEGLGCNVCIVANSNKNSPIIFAEERHGLSNRIIVKKTIAKSKADENDANEKDRDEIIFTHLAEV